MKYLLLLLSFALATMAFSAKILVTASESDAEIYSNGQKIGTGSATVLVSKNSSSLVEVKKVGFLTSTQTFYKKKGMAKPPRTFHFQLVEDDSYTSSELNNLANIDFAVEYKSDLDESEMWRTAVMIVTDFFDVIEVSDKETLYLRTSWQAQSFSANTVRTRVILKSGGDGVIKIKLISEYSDSAGTSVKSDQSFKEWDRVLRKYNNLIPEFQNRLKN